MLPLPCRQDESRSAAAGPGSPRGGMPGSPATSRPGCHPLLRTASLLLAALGAVAAGQELGQTIPADDLPGEARVLWGADPARAYRWTLVARNGKAADQAALHPQLNAVRAIWHLPLTRDHQAFRFDFAAPVRTGANVFHLYLKTDGDDKTGRRHEGVHNGVDYMFTLIDGDPKQESTRMDLFEADGRGRRSACTVTIQGERVYLVSEMSVQQQDGHSVFECHVLSYVKDNGPSMSFGYCRAVSEAAPAPAAGRGLLLNPELRMVSGAVPGWQLTGGRRPLEAVLTEHPKDGALVVDRLFSPEALAQTVRLAPGHYLFRALVKTNVFQIHLFAATMRLPIGVVDEYKWVEIPFHLPLPDKDAPPVATQVGFRYVERPATGNASRLPARLCLKKTELLRLGDTVLPNRWAENLAADPLHRLKLLAAAPAWRRPGKVVFQDAFIGAELWLMTQEGQCDHSYVGHPDFSHAGKYLQIGFRRPPRGVLRTDGSARYLNDAWNGLLWLFPWEQKRLPAAADPADWIVTARSPGAIRMQNVVTGQTHSIELPTRPGWRLVHFPGFASYGGRGPNTRAITYETLVWLADDRHTLARSNVDGQGFRTFAIKSVSPKPADDKLYESMSSVGGKGGDNWRDAVDRDGNRYFLFELNRDNFPNHASNPYQIWALSLTPSDERGLLRVVFNPAAKITEFVTSQTGMTPQPSANWWEFAAGFSWSGDNAILLLEDGTLVHMSSLGMHSAFAGGSTVSVNCPYTGEVRFVGSFHKFDRITWPHEFRRDRDFAVVASHCEPATPLVMLDLEHTTMWTIALTNFHDYTMRYKTRWDPKAYHKPMFRPAPTFSSDFTKVIYFSSMLTGDRPDRLWGDVYVAVVRYPEPPVNLRQAGSALVWEPPHRRLEVQGYNLYRSNASGRDYARVNRELLTAPTFPLGRDSAGFYVATSVEHSGLESRVFSNEARVGAGGGPFRHFYEPETLALAEPMVPFFEPAGASGAYAVAIVDPELVYCQRLADGLTGSVTLRVAVPQSGNVRILGRVRGMSAIERASYTRGWPGRGEVGKGSFAVKVNGRAAGAIAVKGPEWHWIALDAGAVPLAASDAELVLSTSDAAIALDQLLVTNDPEFVPRGRGQAPDKLAATPTGLRTVPFGAQDAQAARELLEKQEPRVKLTWDPVSAPQGVAHYNVYRATTERFAAEPETLLGSPAAPVFYDCGLAAGETVYYCVCAVDAWGNQSPACAPLAVKVTAPSLRAAFRASAAPDAAAAGAFTFDAAPSQADAGRINAWRWSFGDGTEAQGAKVTHAFAASGTYIVRLEIGTDRDEWARTEQAVRVPAGWERTVRERGAVWVEAESHTGEGGGASQRLTGRVNASGAVVSFWEKDIGHWLEWSVQVPKPGPYAIAMKYATGSPQAVRACQIDGQSPGEAWTQLVFPGTGGFSAEADNWAWRALADKDGRPLRIELTAGTHALRLTNQGGGMALDAILVVPFDVLPAAF